MRNLLVFIFLSFLIFNPSISAQSGDTGVLSYREENARWGWYDYGKEEEDGKYVGEILNMKPKTGVSNWTENKKEYGTRFTAHK